MQIDLTKPGSVHLTSFPDGTPHIRLADPSVVPGATYDVRARLRTPGDLWALASLVNAVHRSGGRLGRLDLPYLMGTRYDRVMQPGDAVDIEVVADAINAFGFQRVRILDPHSDVSVALIKRSEAVSNEFLVRTYTGRDAVLVIPDAGAVKKAKSYREWARITDEVHCIKSRGPDGAVALKVLTPERCAGRSVVVIDDICDGGATFAAIAEQVRAHRPSSLTLIVTHGIFSRGSSPLRGFDSIIYSDSFGTEKPAVWFTCVPSVI